MPNNKLCDSYLATYDLDLYGFIDIDYDKVGSKSFFDILFNRKTPDEIKKIASKFNSFRKTLNEIEVNMMKNILNKYVGYLYF